MSASSGEGERRRGDRRRGDRRTGADGTPDRRRATAPAPADDAGRESVFDPGWAAALRQSAAQDGSDGEDAAVRIYRTYAAARAVFGLALVAAQGASALLGARAPIELVLVSIAYAVQAITLWLLPRYHAAAVGPAAPQGAAVRRRQWLSTIGVDLLAFGTLHVTASGSSFNYAALLVLPVLMSGVLTQRLLALATAAGVALMLLLTAWRASLAGGDPAALMLQSGLAGLGLFAIALLSGELALRLVREQQAARGSLRMARQQAQLNRLVIEEMVDGVLVVDAELRVRAANPSARALLAEHGVGPPAPFALRGRPAWEALARGVEEALRERDWPEAGRDLLLDFGPGARRGLRVRMRFTSGRALGDDAGWDGPAAVPAGEGALAVLLLEDVRSAQARLRQEKLAAMGRVSAGIAHEIRNPLSAIAQANALLLEDPLPEPQARLARMVADNAARLKRIVDDVMALAGGHDHAVVPIDAAAVIGTAVDDWRATSTGAVDRLHVDLRDAVGAPPIVFDAEHLRRVIVNLLDNAHRHASSAPGAVTVTLTPTRGAGGVQLCVGSDGPPIAQEVERHLFEPFFSTRSRGSGLGLYICRELCERYGAAIDYRLRRRADGSARNEFVVTLRSTPRSPTA